MVYIHNFVRTRHDPRRCTSVLLHLIFAGLFFLASMLFLRYRTPSVHVTISNQPQLDVISYTILGCALIAGRMLAWTREILYRAGAALFLKWVFRLAGRAVGWR